MLDLSRSSSQRCASALLFQLIFLKLISTWSGVVALVHCKRLRGTSLILLQDIGDRNILLLGLTNLRVKKSPCYGGLHFHHGSYSEGNNGVSLFDVKLLVVLSCLTVNPPVVIRCC